MAQELLVLIVDDDDEKAESVSRLVRETAGVDEVLVSRAKTAHEAAESLQNTQFDLMVLDIMLPPRSGEEPQPDGGMRVLRSLSGRRAPKLPGHIIGLTAYDDLAATYGPEFGREMWFVVHYDPAQTEWSDGIRRRLDHVVAVKTSSTSDSYDFDLGIVTALHRVELESVLALPGGWEQRSLDGDDAIYHVGTFERGNSKVRVVAASAVEMGMCAAATLSMKMIASFRPKVLAMAGIAAGVSGAPGDILVAEQSWDYGSGKSIDADGEGEIFLPAPSAIQLTEELKYKHHWFGTRKTAVESIQSRWPGDPYPDALSVKIGPLASGAAVLANRRIIDEIIGHNRKLIGVEMEAYGVFMAARNCREPRPSAMVIKSICDFADSKKKDDFQSYAAFTSANYLYEFSLEMLA